MRDKSQARPQSGLFYCLKVDQMFGFIANLATAALKVAVAPVAVVADIVLLPTTADGTVDHPMQKTAELLQSAGRDYSRALK